jgi:hypothetical protein
MPIGEKCGGWAGLVGKARRVAGTAKPDVAFTRVGGFGGGSSWVAALDNLEAVYEYELIFML